MNITLEHESLKPNRIELKNNISFEYMFLKHSLVGVVNVEKFKIGSLDTFFNMYQELNEEQKQTILEILILAFWSVDFLPFLINKYVMTKEEKIANCLNCLIDNHRY